MGTFTNLTTALADRYRIAREIGAGGMATVYLARDLRHDRDVALKVLKPELAAVVGTERFLSEIRVTARLQHPNLLPLFDSGECDGQLYYVMPFVEGESLRARLNREKQLPVREAVRLACAVAGALDYAHRHGVVHRDLKPENILLQEHQPLVADFGIALALSNAGGERVTQTGLSLGTPQYMSPEQATGERVIDGRSDIYSLGAVLYEMLTGEPPHTGATVQAIVARVITETPRSVRVHRPAVPEYVDQAIARALEKVPADRFASARELVEALESERVTTGTKSTAAPSEAPSTSFPKRRLRRALPWGIAAIAASIALASLLFGAYAWRQARDAASANPVQFVITPTGQERILPFGMQVSPDGQIVVYTGATGGETKLYARRLDDLRATPIAGTEDPGTPLFSPDGRWLAFFQNDELKRLPMQGGGAVSIARGVQPYDFAWTGTNQLIVPTSAFTQQRTGLSILSPAGGAPRPVIISDTAHRERLDHPFVLDDGETVIMRSAGPGGYEDDRLAIGSLASGRYDTLQLLVSAVLGYAERHAIVLQWNGTRSTLAALPIDVRSRKATGDPITLVEGIPTPSGAALSRNGTLVYASGAPLSQLMSVDRANVSQVLTPDLRSYMQPRLAPDGRLLAFALPAGAGGELWVMNLSDHTVSRLETQAEQPEWAPDGRSIVFARTQTAGVGIWRVPVDGSAPAQQLQPKLPPGVGPPHEPSIATDGKTVAFVGITTQGRRNIYWFVPGVDDTAHPWVATASDEFRPRFSPDGKWMAYVSDEVGSYEVYVRPFPGPGGRVQVSSGGGSEPTWAADGSRLYFRSNFDIIAADLQLGAGATVLRRTKAFTITNDATVLSQNSYTITRDGQRLIEARAAGGDARLVVIVNWLSELRRRIAEAKP